MTQAHLHVQLAAVSDSRDVDVFVQHLDVGVRLDHSRPHRPGLLNPQSEHLGTLALQLEGNLLQVENNIGSVFHHAGNRAELVQHALDFHRGDGHALDGAE